MIIDKLPKDRDGLVLFQVGAYDDDEPIPFSCFPDTLARMFPIVNEKKYPLNDNDFQMLLDKSSNCWRQAWEWAKNNNYI